MLHGYIPPHRFLPYLSWTEIAALPDRENTVIVLPCGAIEQHGPHLPCSVDSVISSGVMGKALEKLPAEVRAFALPTITYGKSEEHLHFPGTMTLTGTTLLSTVTEIGESVYRAGFRKLLFANGHAGQVERQPHVGLHAGPGHQRGRLEHEGHPVSYTHLTLPTKA